MFNNSALILKRFSNLGFPWVSITINKNCRHIIWTKFRNLRISKFLHSSHGFVVPLFVSLVDSISQCMSQPVFLRNLNNTQHFIFFGKSNLQLEVVDLLTVHACRGIIKKMYLHIAEELYNTLKNYRTLVKHLFNPLKTGENLIVRRNQSETS